jgi:hypothetical protein
MTPRELTRERAIKLTDKRRYDLASIAWMAFLGVLAVAIWSYVLPQILGRSAPQRSVEARDDAQAIISRFGHPEADSAVDATAVSTVRTLTYRARHVRVAFVRHGSRHAPVTWKLTGFLDLESDAVVDGGEAYRRLTGTWR